MIYLDNAATTFPKPEIVYESINYAMRQYSFNAGRGVYKESQEVHKMIENTRDKIGNLIDISGKNVVFTSSATEALNNIIYGLNLSVNDVVFVSPFEHNAVIRTLFNIGVRIQIIPFSKDTWEINELQLHDLYVVKKPKATIISHISNVTGFELPYQKIFEISKSFNSINILDCAQSLGIYNVEKEFTDFIVFAGHKSLYAMLGIAGYINITNYDLKIYKVGGTGTDSLNPKMPNELPIKYEAGSPNSVGIYSINKSLDYLQEKKYFEYEDDLTKYLINKLSKLDYVIIYLPVGYISRGIVSFNVKGYTSNEVGTILNDDYKICLRAGYHCAPYIHDFIDSIKFAGTVRVSIGIFNTYADIDCLIDALEEINNESR